MRWIGGRHAPGATRTPHSGTELAEPSTSRQTAEMIGPSDVTDNTLSQSRFRMPSDPGAPKQGDPHPHEARGMAKISAASGSHVGIRATRFGGRRLRLGVARGAASRGIGRQGLPARGDHVRHRTLGGESCRDTSVRPRQRQSSAAPENTTGPTSHPATQMPMPPAPPWITPITMPPPKPSTAPARSWTGSSPKLPRAPWSRDERLERARAHVERLGLGRYRALLFGSVARGDFTSESDTDVLIVSDELPQDIKPRLDLIFDARNIAPEVEPIGWTSAEWADCKAQGGGFIAILRPGTVLIAARAARPPGDANFSRPSGPGGLQPAMNKRSTELGIPASRRLSSSGRAPARRVCRWVSLSLIHPTGLPLKRRWARPLRVGWIRRVPQRPRPGTAPVAPHPPARDDWTDGWAAIIDPKPPSTPNPLGSDPQTKLYWHLGGRRLQTEPIGATGDRP